MREYLLRRLLLLIPTLLGVTFIVFLMMHFIPKQLPEPVILQIGASQGEKLIDGGGLWGSPVWR